MLQKIIINKLSLNHNLHTVITICVFGPDIKFLFGASIPEFWILENKDTNIPTFCNKFHCCESDVRFAGKSHFLTRIRFFSSVKQYSSIPGELPSLHRISPFFVLVKSCSRLSLVRHLVKVKFISNNVSLLNVTQ